MKPQQVAPDSELSMKVNLYISGRNLADLDYFSKSDPVCRVYACFDGKWARVGTTERVNDDLNPNFERAITVPYFFEKKQKILFEMIDCDGHGTYDYIGSFETTLGTIMGAKRQVLERPLTADGVGNRGSIIVRAEAVQTTKKVAKF